MLDELQILLLGVAERPMRQILQENRRQAVNAGDLLDAEALQLNQLHLLRIEPDLLHLMAHRKRHNGPTLTRQLCRGLGHVIRCPCSRSAALERPLQHNRGDTTALERLGPVAARCNRHTDGVTVGRDRAANINAV